MAGGKQRGPRPPSTRGDYTGNKKEALQKEHAEAVDARREELGIISSQQQTIKQDGVIDMMGEKPMLDLPTPDLQQALSEQLAALHPTQDGPIADATRLEVDTTGEPSLVPPADPVPPQGKRLGDGKTTIDVFELEPEKPRAALTAGEAIDKDRLNEPTLIRSLYDLEDVTIGYGNTFNFRADYKYRVPRWVAIHLEEKGLCDVLSLSLA